MPRMKSFECPRFPDDVLQVHAVDGLGNNISITLTELDNKMDDHADELKRIRRANELIVGDDVDVPED